MRVGGTGLAERVLVAGGGGGGNAANGAGCGQAIGGAGGGLNGGDGNAIDFGCPADPPGGGQAAGSGSGMPGQGGAGVNGVPGGGDDLSGGGGGGGGWYGGAGAALPYSSGGGGSGHGPDGVAFETGVRDGDGLISVSYAAPPQTMLAGVGGTASYGEATATLRATLQRPPSGPGVAGRTVSFTLDGRAAGSATTGADGTAQVAGVPLGARAAGSYARVVCASFAGAGADPPSGPTCGPLKVAKRVLWVQPKAQARAAGAANPGCASVADAQLVAPAPANTGLANGDTLATAVTATPGFFSCTYGVTSGTPAKPSKPGTYTILASGLTAQNYDIRYKAGTLTVTP